MTSGAGELLDVTRDGEVILRVHVQPGAARTAVAGRHGDALKVRVAAPPEGGKANAALTRFLATELGLPRQAVEIVGGATSRRKRVRLHHVTSARVTAWLREG